MIISFKNLNGGGGGGYVLPTATPTTLGGVKIGDGINVENDGTISVSGGGDSTKLVSVSELPLTANTGDVYVMGDIHIYPKCQIEDNNMNTLSVGEHTIGNEEKLYVLSEMADDELVLKYGDYYNYRLYIYGGQDQHFRFETKGWNGVEETEIESGYIYQGETATTEFQNESVTFNFNYEGESLEITISTPQSVPFTVFYNQEHNEMFLNDGTFMAKDSGERAVLNAWDDYSYGNHNRHIVFLYYGELPQNEILFKVHHNQWNNDTYWSWDGDKLCAWNDENMSDRNTEWDMPIGGFKYNTFYMWNFTEGILSIASRELEDVWELYGDWYKYNEMTYEPIDWQNRVNNIKSFALPLAYGKINGVPFLGGGDLQIGSVPFDGKKGQVLTKTTDDYGDSTYFWRNLAKEVQLVDSLPAFAEEDTFAIANSGVTYSPSNAFCAKNTTSSDGKNNFSDYDEFAPFETMNFVNGDLSSTTKTLIGRIAMRTYDWDWNSVAYINVFREYDSVNQAYFFSWDMPPYDYEDNEGQHHTYSTSGVVDSVTTSVDSMVIPIARLYYDGYGYRFNFTYNNGNLAISMLYDNDNGTYGDVNVRFTNHTTEFYNGMSTEGNATTLYTFKGGAWYKLGDLA